MRLCGIAAHISSSLLLGHAHTTEHPFLLCSGAQPGIILKREQLRQPVLGRARLPAEHRNGGMRHRDWAAMPGLNLGKKVESSGPRHMASRHIITPGGGMHSPGHRMLHQVMVGGMKLHFIDAVSVTVVRLQHRLVRIGVEPPLDGLFSSSEGANMAQALLCPASSLALNAFNQGAILRKNIVIDQRWWLIKYRMRAGLDNRSLVHNIHTIFLSTVSHGRLFLSMQSVLTIKTTS